MADAWLRATGHLVRSAVEVNRATLAAYGFSEGDRTSGGPSVAYARPEWDIDREVDEPGELTVGDTIRFTKTMTDEDVAAFADISGDTNRLHLEDEFATESRFGDRIIHGTLVSGLISAALARLPGLTIYLSQDVTFLAPAYIGDRLTATIEIVDDLEGNQYMLSTDVHNESGKQLINGEAVVLIDPVPEPDE
ncbi:MAG: MaoC family dehydratase [Halohasta sp.]